MTDQKKWRFENIGYGHHVKELDHDENFMYPIEVREIIREFQKRSKEPDTVQYYETFTEEEKRYHIGFKSGTGNTLCIYPKRRLVLFYLTS